MTEPQPQPQPGPGSGSADSRNWAMAAHLSALVLFLSLPPLLGPLVVWLIKKDQDPYVAEHAREALNFQISVLIYIAAAGLVTLVGAVATLGIGLILIVPVGVVAVVAALIAWFVVVIIAGVKAANGEGYRYPLTIRLVN